VGSAAVLTVRKRAIALAAYKDARGHFRGATTDDCATRITENTVLVDAESGAPAIVYLRLPEEPRTTAIRAALQRIKYESTARTNGMKTHSRVFGFSPRNTIRRDYCNAATLHRDAPEAAALLTEYAHDVARYYEQFHPTLFAQHGQMVERVLPEWRLKDSPFTSGIINQNNVLPYHHDAGNFKGVWSNMLVFKHDVVGGELAVPEYDVRLAVDDNTLTMFDGQQLLHGVTPMKRLSPRAFRFSVVYYALQQMWKCEDGATEVRRIQQLRTERERARAREEQRQ